MLPVNCTGANNKNRAGTQRETEKEREQQGSRTDGITDVETKVKNEHRDACHIIGAGRNQICRSSAVVKRGSRRGPTRQILRCASARPCRTLLCGKTQAVAHASKNSNAYLVISFFSSLLPRSKDLC